MTEAENINVKVKRRWNWIDHCFVDPTENCVVALGLTPEGRIKRTA